MLLVENFKMFFSKGGEIAALADSRAYPNAARNLSSQPNADSDYMSSSVSTTQGCFGADACSPVASDAVDMYRMVSCVRALVASFDRRYCIHGKFSCEQADMLRG
jgi:hypothetical protein